MDVTTRSLSFIPASLSHLSNAHNRSDEFFDCLFLHLFFDFGFNILVPKIDKNALVSARPCGKHQDNKRELARVDALSPRLLLSLTSVVNLFGVGSLFMRLLDSMDMHFNTCMLDIRSEPPPQESNYFATFLGNGTMRNYRCDATQKQKNKTTQGQTSRAENRRRRTSREGLLMLKIKNTNAEDNDNDTLREGQPT